MSGRLNIRVIPRARRNAVEPQSDGSIRVYTTAAPSDGEANSAVIKMLAKYLNVPKTSIMVVRGTTSRDKVIEY